LPCPLTIEGKIDLHAAILKLREIGIRSVMIEGGARIISHILTRSWRTWRSSRFARYGLGGLRLAETPLNRSSGYPGLEDLIYEQAGRDLVIWGKLKESKV